MTLCLSVTNLTHSYIRGAEVVHALNDVSLDVADGEFVAVVGHSGCGKTTLLNIVGLVDTPSSGDVLLAGEVVDFKDSKRLLELRRLKIGYIFQSFRLLPDLTAVENVMLPMILSGSRRSLAKEEAANLLTQVGLGDRVNFYPRQLSGGQMQRVAVCRALAGSPRLILADEPTGNLDESSGATVLDLLHRAARKGVGVLMATHSEMARDRADRALAMRDGSII